MTKKDKKLKWERIDDSFDLKLVNTDAVHNDLKRKLKELHKKVETSSANWRKDMHFNKKASDAFEKWFSDPSMPLPGYAYALLSNWFKTGLKFIVESPRGISALELWKSMFCAVPDNRLTDPKKDYKILLAKFNLWWPKQQDCQDDC